MKKIKSAFLLSVLTLTLFSCKKDNDNNNNNNSGGGTMSAKIDGTPWTATLAVQGSNTSGVFSVGGTGSQGQINLNVSSYTGPGTYTIGMANPGTMGSYSTTSGTINSWVATAVNGSGTITVSSQNGNRIQGTFEFTASDNSTTKTITEGAFDVTVQ